MSVDLGLILFQKRKTFKVIFKFLKSSILLNVSNIKNKKVIFFRLKVINKRLY